jgi:replicative DNA helicase
MNYENLLLNRLIQDRSITPLFERNVDENWFTDVSDLIMWRFIRDHYNDYGQCPSLELIQNNFPKYSYVVVSDSLEFYVDRVLDNRRRGIINEAFNRAIIRLEKDQDSEGAVDVFTSHIAKLEEGGFTPASDVDITFKPEQRWDEYLDRKNLPGGLLGMATGFATIDEATSGLQAGQLIVVVAPPKTGKSTLLLQMAYNVHLTGEVPVFQSFEMTNQEQVSRYDAMRSRLSHHRLRTGTLTTEEETRYQAKLKSLSNIKHKFWLTDSASASNISSLRAKIQQLQPTVLFVDGVYLMIDEQSGEMNTPQALTNITRSLKRLAQQFQIPIVISTQVLNWKMKNGNVTADSIGYSSSFLQDADVLFGLQREDESVDDTRVLKVLESRNSGRLEVSMVWDWNTGEFRELSGEDM